MFRSSLVILLFVGCVTTQAAEVTSFSEPATPDDIKRVYWGAFPDGDNLPAGSGSAALGKPLFEAHCASCHGLKGEGLLEARLVGGVGTLASETPVKTIGSYWPYATTVFSYIRRAMPYTAPMSLANDDYYAITAYILSMNNIIKRDAVMDKKTLPQVKMPNRNGFVKAYPKVPEEYDFME